MRNDCCPAPNRELRQEPCGLAPCVQRAVAVPIHRQKCFRAKLTDLIRDRGTEPEFKFGKGVLISRSCAARQCRLRHDQPRAPHTTTALPRSLADMAEQPIPHGNSSAPDSTVFRRRVQLSASGVDLLCSLGQVGFVWSNSTAPPVNRNQVARTPISAASSNPPGPCC